MASDMYSEHDGVNLQDPANNGEIMSLYPLTAARATTAAGPILGAAASGRPLEELGEVCFEVWKGSIQHFTPGDDHDVVSARGFVAPEDLSGQTLGAIAFDRAAQLSCGGHTQPGSGRPVGQQEQGDESAVFPLSGGVDALEFRPPANPLGDRQPLRARVSYPSSETVSRFRPFARRRARTIRPFFVDIRTRNPCVFFRRRVLG
jgi:hypothetical protein